MTLIAFALVAVVGLWLHIRSLDQARRDFEDRVNAQHDRHAKHLQSVLAQKNPDLEQLIALVDRQMQRIQAPQQAVIDHSVGALPPSPPAVGFDDDAGFWASRGLDKDALAEAEMAAEREVTSGAA